ncbi:hypothetical protein [Lysinibacillus xylanilyticus]
MEKKEFEFADFKINSQEWDTLSAYGPVVTGCSDNGREFWDSSEQEEEEK